MKQVLISTAIVASFFIPTLESNAQVINPGRRAKDKGEQRANDHIDRTIDKGFDKIDEGLDNIFNGKKKNNSGASNSDNNNTTVSQNNQGQYNSSSTSQQSGSHTDFSKYKSFDFIPGKNIIFFDNFSDGSKARWKAYDPNHINVASIQGSNWLEMKGTRFTPINLGLLPEEVTIEMDAYVRNGKQPCGTLEISFVEQSQKDRLEDPWLDNSSTVTISPITQIPKTAFISYEKKKDNQILGSSATELAFKTWQPELGNTHARISIARKGNKVSVYINNEKLLDNIDLLNSGMKYMLSMHLQNYFVEETRMYLTNVRIASGTPHAVSEVKSQGKFVTNTIYFDVNSARIKPESWATLKESAEAVKANNGNFLIVGHTDSDGDDDANLKLSQSRAASVKNALVKEFGIPASRLITDGKGESQPVTSNNTISGKAQNRRVEFIKQ